MEIEQAGVTKLNLTELDALDPVSVFIEDYEPGRGKITFECYGKSWSYYWDGMSGKGVAEFFLSCDVCYLTNCLWDHSLPKTELDYDGIQLSVRKWVIESRRDYLIDKSTARFLYDESDWSIHAPQHTYDDWTCPYYLDDDTFENMSFLHEQDVPEKSTSDYVYLARIIEAIQEAFSQISKKEDV